MLRKTLFGLLTGVVVLASASDATARCDATWCICEDERGRGCTQDDDVVVINDPIAAIVIIGAKILEDPEGAADAVGDAIDRGWEETKDFTHDVGGWVWDKLDGDPPPSPVFPDGSRTVEQYGDRRYVAVRREQLRDFNDQLETSINQSRERTAANERVLSESLPEMTVPEIPDDPRIVGRR